MRTLFPNSAAAVSVPQQHVDTPDNTADTPWDFTKENYDKINEVGGRLVYSCLQQCHSCEQRFQLCCRQCHLRRQS